MPFVWVTLVGVGADIDAADRNETKTHISTLYTTLGANWPGNVRFPVCAGAGYDMAAPCPVVWDIAVGDSIYQTPTAHPVSELQEARDKLDWIWDNKCATDNAGFDSGEDFGEDIGANTGADTGEDAGDNVGANIGEDTGEDAGDNVGANVGEDTAEDIGADSGANVGADSGANAGADSGADVGDDIGVNVGEDTAELVGANTGEDVGAEGTVNVGDNIGAFGVHDGLYRNADCLTDDVGAYSVDQDTNWGPDFVIFKSTVYDDYDLDPGFCFIVYFHDH